MRRLTCVVAAVALAVLQPWSALAQDDGRCLDNSGRRSVLPGVTYRDDAGTWLCDPSDPAATAGGWVRRPAPATVETLPPTPTPLPPTATPPSEVSGATPPDGGEEFLGVFGIQLYWLLLGAASVVGLLFLGLLRWANGRKRLAGYLVVEDSDAA